MKECNACFTLKPYEEFNKKKNSRDGYKHQCKDCTKVSNSARYYANVEFRRQRQREIQRVYTAKKFGLTEAELVAMYEAQGHKCAICGVTEEQHGKYFAIDHCHTTGKVRGLLCMPCNTGLGNFRDDTYLMSKAIQYLEDKDDSI